MNKLHPFGILSLALLGILAAGCSGDVKIGAVVLRNTRRVRFLLTSHHPYQDLFFKVAARLAPG